MALVLTIDGTDITDEVEFTKSNFVALVNGQPGVATIIYKDPNRVKSFTIGDRILLAIDGLNMWSGYLMRTRRIYPFPQNSPPSLRLFELVGLDLNVLFSKRIVFNQSDPSLKSATYPAYTNDTTVLADLFSDWIDLGGDNLDLSSLVSNVGTINQDQPASPFFPAQSWSNTMQLLARLLSPVWYLNPDRKLVWADVDVEDAPFSLTDIFSDDPEIRATQRGYREFRLTMDGTEMINDALFVGAGNGDAGLVYKRSYDSTSQILHGRWQVGGLVGGIYKQASIDRIANSYVFGSPLSKRGRKDDKVVATLSTFDAGFRVGQKINLISGVWGYDDILPVRQMRITWPVAFEPKYEMVLSHELDSPFSFFDTTNIVPYKPPPIYVPPEIPGSEPPDPPRPKPIDWRDNLEFFVETGQANDPIEPNYDDLTNSFEEFIIYQPDMNGTQVMFETFNRANSSVAWGTSTDGHVWSMYSLLTTGESAIVSTRGEETVHGPSWLYSRWQSSFGNKTNKNGAWSVPDWVLTWSWRSYYELTNPGGRVYWFRIGLRDEDTDDEPWWIKVSWNGYGVGYISDNFGNLTDINVGPPGTDNNVKTTVHLGDDDDDIKHKTCLNNTSCVERDKDKDPEGNCDDPCSELITDTFTRTVVGSLGHSDSGIEWANDAVGPSVDGARAIFGTVSRQEGASLSFTPGSQIEMTFDLQVDQQATGTQMIIELTAAKINLLSGLGQLYVVRKGSVWGESTVAYDPGTGVNHFRLLIDSMSTKVKAWRAGNPEPAGWTADVSCTGPDPFGSPDYIDFLSYNAVGGNSLTYLDNLDISGVTACTEYRFDNFNRTVTGGWGTSDAGSAWKAFSYYPLVANVYVDGSRGVIYRHGGGGNQGYVYCDDFAGPWRSEVKTSFTMLMRFTVDAISDVSNEYTIFGVHDGTGANAPDDGIALRFRSSLPAGPSLAMWVDEGTLETSFAWAEGTTYLLMWERTWEGVSRVKCWVEGSAEPDWMLSGTVSGTYTGAEFTFATQGGGTTDLDHKVSIDYIDFDYAGKPCYQDCSGTDCSEPRFDDFNRTVASGWGTSDDGHAWVATGTGGSSSVSGGSHFSSEGYTHCFSNNITQTVAGTGPWAIGSDFTLTTAIYMYGWGFTVPGTGFVMNAGQWGAGGHINVVPRLDGLVDIGVGDGFGTTWAYSQDIGWVYGVGNGGLVNIKWENTPSSSTSRVKVWGSGAEPSGWTATRALTISSASEKFSIYTQAGGPWPSTFDLYIDYIDFDFPCCVDVLPAPDKQPLSGWVCENFQGGGSAISLSNDYTLTTVSVYLNGKAETDFTADSGNSVSLGFGTTPSDSIMVCYLIAGSGSGWDNGGGGGGAPYPI